MKKRPINLLCMCKFKTHITLVFIAIFFNSCFGLFDSSADTIIGRYNVCWIDIPSSRSISIANKDGGYGGAVIIPEYVYAVGHNKKFIIAKQHPVMDEAVGKVDVKKTNYFIIDLHEENYYKQRGIYGPLNEGEFDSLIKKLNVGEIIFNMNYPEQP